MAPLTSDTIIAVAAGASIEVQEGAVWISNRGVRFDGGRPSLTVFELFATPKSLAQAMAELSKRGSDPKIWMQVSAMVYQMWEAGILGDGSSPQAPLPVKRRRVEQSGIHTQVRMLDDKTRTDGFLRAIRATVKPGDVVLDIGTGTGVLAIAAAQAGAKRVYAMEMTGMADVAEAMFAANGVADRVTLLRGRSYNLELPEKADVLVTEIIGDGPLGEGVLETISDARGRLLAPNARIIPKGITIGVVALRLPDDLLKRYIFTDQSVANWNSDYAIDFAATQQALNPDQVVTYRLRTADYQRCEVLTKPTVLKRIDLQDVSSAQLRVSTSITLESDGPVHAVAMYFDLEIGAGERLSTAPAGSQATSISADNHWRIPLSLRLQPVETKKGQTASVEFSYADGITNLRLTL
ncbi:MAG TPA: 50S ribosomal protein L11 methyltransferase [Terriglobales bacterium]|nr:50S ribosomal protein L11 methyltransferase [Terriglobales bacterium]